MARASRAERTDHAGRVVADIVEAAGAIRRLGDEIAGAVQQTQARWSVLSVLSEGEWTASQAARRLGVTRQSVQRVVDLLLEEGLVATEANPDHARSPLLRLTDEGRRTLETITAASDPWQERLGERVSLDDLLTARRVIAEVTDAAREGAGLS